MAWFIGQSAVMIVLAFLLGLLVGWIIWGRRVRGLLIEIRTLRTAVEACEANHGDRTDADRTDLPAVVAAPAVHIPSPRSEVPDAAVLDVAARSHSGGVDDDDDDDLGEFEDDNDELDNAISTTELDETDFAVAELDAIDLYESDTTDGSRRVMTAETAVAGAGQTDDSADDLVVDSVAESSVVPTEEGGDDLVRIEGIGPKIAAALAAAGIRTYRQLADADDSTLTAAIQAGGIRFAPSLVTWAEQARLLADGDESAFLALTDRLIAGRDVSKTAKGDDVPPPPPDDLARIEGIGPKIASALVAAGIRTFQQLADANDETLAAAIKEAGISFAPSLVTWAEQARLLADGDEDAFAVLTARLIAGRRVDDDLERIEGIGPKMAAALQASGIRTYRALADSSDTRLRNAITGSGLKFAPSIVTWARQARLLADGDEEGFADLTRRLVAGRDEGRA